MSIWKTQAVHDAATAALKRHPLPKPRGAFVEVEMAGEGTTAALLRHEEGAWRIQRLYTPEHEHPRPFVQLAEGAASVLVVAVW